MSNEDIQNKVDVAMVKATYEQKIKQLKADHKKQIKDLKEQHRLEILQERSKSEYQDRKIQKITENLRSFFRMANEYGMVDDSDINNRDY